MFEKHTWAYGACPTCGLVHLDPMPKPDEATSLFGASYFSGGGAGEYVDYVGDEELHRVNARAQLRGLEQVRPGPPGKLLDVGCAHGFMLDEARAAGWDGQGVEIANVAAQHARDRFGFVVHPDLDAAAASGERFDVVTFLQVVAHLPSGADALEAAHERAATRRNARHRDRESREPHRTRSRPALALHRATVGLVALRRGDARRPAAPHGFRAGRELPDPQGREPLADRKCDGAALRTRCSHRFARSPAHRRSAIGRFAIRSPTS